MFSIAYNKRNIPLIKLRKLIHGLFKIWKIVNQTVFFISGKKSLKLILVFTYVDNKNQLGDIVNRILWAFPERENILIKIIVPKKLSKIKIEELSSPDNQYQYIRSVPHIKFITKIEIIDILKSNIIITTKFLRPIIVFSPYLVGKLEIADPYYYSWTEGNIWMKKYYYILPKHDKKYFKNLSKENFAKLIKKYNRCSVSYCFMTGPTFNNYKKFCFEDDSLKIICNTIIKNKQFLSYIKQPDILTFADCVFHFGSSKYAGIYRERVLDLIQEYNCYLIVPNVTVPLLLAHYSGLSNNIIGLGKTKRFNFPSINNLNVYGTKSISTYFMLPIASALTDKIYILGADGRKANENYFWKHNTTVQYNNLMETVFKTHPSFFRDRIYTSDYKEYCKKFEQLIKYGEREGKQYFTLTKSYIPALTKRLYKME